MSQKQTSVQPAAGYLTYGTKCTKFVAACGRARGFTLGNNWK
ncbi:hypothetical protein V5F49_03235 [Xanthobacter sp. V3C-3]